MKKLKLAALAAFAVVCLSVNLAAAGDDVVLKQADINISTSGDNTVIAAVTGKQISVYKIWIVVGGADNLIFKDGTTAFNAGVLPLTANGSSITFPFDGKNYWSTTSGNAFVINTSTTAQLTGRVYYALQ